MTPEYTQRCQYKIARPSRAGIRLKILVQVSRAERKSNNNFSNCFDPNAYLEHGLEAAERGLALIEEVLRSERQHGIA